MKKLGFGCMRFPLLNADEPTSVDLDQVCAMVDLFLKRGFTYFDTAYFYHRGTSENVLQKALVDRHSRDSFTLADKMPVGMLKNRGPEDQERIFHEQLRKCGVDHFDYYLLHNLNRESYQTAQRLDSFAFISRMRGEGKIRRIGFSFHDDAATLDRILTDHPEVEFVQLQINYLDWEDPKVQSRLCYETARRHGKQVVIMEPVKGGKLAAPPQAVLELFQSRDPAPSVASWAIRFAASLDGVMVVLSGMSTLEQVEDNTTFMADLVPLSGDERAMLVQAADLIRSQIAIPCTACAYCVAGCPQGIPIPDYFAMFNTHRQFPESGQAAAYAQAGKPLASACVACGQCESVCPQHIEVISGLKQVAATFEG